ncbi:MAG: hypothetical protein GWO24_23570, partial [Akkermansiaceae bacterium]|nr:hypothetical protein [Akkermansiaceae bacterium]
MKELIEAAVAAAGKAGLRTAVVVVDGVAPAVEMPMGVAVSSGSDPVVADLEERIKGLKDELEEARKAPAPTP